MFASPTEKGTVFAVRGHVKKHHPGASALTILHDALKAQKEREAAARGSVVLADEGEKIEAGQITTSKIAAGAITTSRIVAAAPVTPNTCRHWQPTYDTSTGHSTVCMGCGGSWRAHTLAPPSLTTMPPVAVKFPAIPAPSVPGRAVARMVTGREPVDTVVVYSGPTIQHPGAERPLLFTGQQVRLQRTEWKMLPWGTEHLAVVRGFHGQDIAVGPDADIHDVPITDLAVVV